MIILLYEIGKAALPGGVLVSLLQDGLSRLYVEIFSQTVAFEQKSPVRSFHQVKQGRIDFSRP